MYELHTTLLCIVIGTGSDTTVPLEATPSEQEATFNGNKKLVKLL